jgi:hypothetical protein
MTIVVKGNAYRMKSGFSYSTSVEDLYILVRGSGQFSFNYLDTMNDRAQTATEGEFSIKLTKPD